MNSSSVLNNALLVTAAPPSKSASLQNDLADDYSRSGFKQAFDEVHSIRDSQVKKTDTKKIIAADKNNSQANTKQNDNLAKKNEPVSADDIDKSAETRVKKSVAKGEENKNKKSEDEGDKKVDGTNGVADTIQKIAQPEPTSTSVSGLSAMPQSGDISDTASVTATTAVPVDANDNIQVTDITSDVKTTSEGKVTAADVVTDNTVALAAFSDKSAVAVTNPTNTDVENDLANKDPAQSDLTADTDTTDALANKVLTDGNADDGARLAMPEVDAPEIKTTNTKVSTQKADDDSSAGDGKTATNTADPKTIFEKMLQAMSNNAGANSDSGSNSKQQDDRTTMAASPTATTASVFDSSVRNTDAQTPAARGFVVQTGVPVTVGQPQWSQAVGEKVLWLAAQNVHSAEISLNPENLGPMQVKVSVNQEQATVSFTSHHPVVREALDQSAGRLRDMFSEQGLNLVNVDVSDRSFQRQQGESNEQQGQGHRGETAEEEESVVAVSNIVQQRLVDHYA